MTFLDDAGLVQLWQNILMKLTGKVDRVPGKGLSANDFTDEEKNKLANLSNLVGEKPIEDQVAEALNYATEEDIENMMVELGLLMDVPEDAVILVCADGYINNYTAQDIQVVSGSNRAWTEEPEKLYLLWKPEGYSQAQYFEANYSYTEYLPFPYNPDIVDGYFTITLIHPVLGVEITYCHIHNDDDTAVLSTHNPYIANALSNSTTV